MGRDVSGNGSSESMYDEGDQNLDRRVGNNTLVTTEADDQSSLHCITVWTDVSMQPHNKTKIIRAIAMLIVTWIRCENTTELQVTSDWFIEL